MADCSGVNATTLPQYIPAGCGSPAAVVSAPAATPPSLYVSQAQPLFAPDPFVGNVNPTTIWTPQTGALSTPGDINSGVNNPDGTAKTYLDLSKVTNVQPAPAGGSNEQQAASLIQSSSPAGYNPAQFASATEAGELAGYLGGSVTVTNAVSAISGQVIPNSYLVSVNGVPLNAGLLLVRYRNYPRSVADQQTKNEIASFGGGVWTPPATAPGAMAPSSPGKMTTTAAPGSELTVTSPPSQGANNAAARGTLFGNPLTRRLTTTTPRKVVTPQATSHPIASRRITVKPKTPTAVSYQTGVQTPPCRFCAQVQAKPFSFFSAFFKRKVA